MLSSHTFEKREPIDKLWVWQCSKHAECNCRGAHPGEVFSESLGNGAQHEAPHLMHKRRVRLMYRLHSTKTTLRDAKWSHTGQLPCRHR